jgi:hypothetical protein
VYTFFFREWMVNLDWEHTSLGWAILCLFLSVSVSEKCFKRILKNKGQEEKLTPSQKRTLYQATTVKEVQYKCDFKNRLKIHETEPSRNPPQKPRIFFCSRKHFKYSGKIYSHYLVEINSYLRNNRCSE